MLALGHAMLYVPWTVRASATSYQRPRMQPHPTLGMDMRAWFHVLARQAKAKGAYIRGLLSFIYACDLDQIRSDQAQISVPPSGMLDMDTRLTSSNAVLWNGTRPLTSGMSRSYTNLWHELCVKLCRYLMSHAYSDVCELICVRFCWGQRDVSIGLTTAVVSC